MDGNLIINEYLEHELLIYKGQQYWIDYLIKQEKLAKIIYSWFNKFKGLSLEGWADVVAESIGYLEFEWEVTSEMIKILHDVIFGEHREKHKEQIRVILRVVGENTTALRVSKITKGFSLLRYRKLESKPIVMMLHFNGERYKYFQLTQVYITRCPTFWLWSKLHPKEPKVKNVSLLLHSITSYRAKDLYPKFEQMVIPSPLPFMRQLLMNKIEAKEIPVVAVSSVEITFSLINPRFTEYWKKWQTGEKKIMYCLYCVSPAKFMCDGCKDTTYCGKECQREDFPVHAMGCVK